MYTKSDIEALGDKIIGGHALSVDEAIAIANSSEKETLYSVANSVRKKFCGDSFDLCSITNAKSGKCSEDCKWCSQSAHHNTDVEVYELIDRAEAVKQAKHNENKGVIRHSLVTSGRTISKSSLSNIIGTYRAIKRECSEIGLCASMGLLSKEQLQELKEVGISHYHCNLETAPSFFSNLCSTHTIDEKIETIKNAMALDIKVCSGGIIGMGESQDQRIELAFTLRDLGVKSIPINILMPIDGTPLEGTPKLTDDEILTTMAIFRLINPDASIRFAGGRILIKHIEKQALRAGVNASIVGDLLTTVGSSIDEDLSNFEKEGFSMPNKSI